MTGAQYRLGAAQERRNRRASDEDERGTRRWVEPRVAEHKEMSVFSFSSLLKRRNQPDLPQ